MSSNQNTQNNLSNKFLNALQYANYAQILNPQSQVINPQAQVVNPQAQPMFNPGYAPTYAQWGQIPSPTMPSPILSQTQLQSQTNDFDLFDMEKVQETQFSTEAGPSQKGKGRGRKTGVKQQKWSTMKGLCLVKAVIDVWEDPIVGAFYTRIGEKLYKAQGREEYHNADQLSSKWNGIK
jgi:hypothetical protein